MMTEPHFAIQLQAIDPPRPSHSADALRIAKAMGVAVPVSAFGREVWIHPDMTEEQARAAWWNDGAP